MFRHGHRQMALIRKSAEMGNFGDGQNALDEEFFSKIEAQPKNISVRRLAEGLRECLDEMAWRKTGDGRKLAHRDLAGKPRLQ